MGIKPKFGNGAVAAQVNAFQVRLEKATVFMLQNLGEELAKYAKERHNYQDQTGNLTNSIGYAVVRQGKILTYGGENQPGEGAAEGLKVAQQMAATLPNSFSLIIVAGMNYAAYVEAKGYNVILPAQLKAMNDFPATVQRLKAMATKKANEQFGNLL
jgi:hypothetical protein